MWLLLDRLAISLWKIVREREEKVTSTKTIGNWGGGGPV